MADDTQVKEQQQEEIKKRGRGDDEPEPKESTVTMTFPRKTAVLDSKGLVQTFEAGIHEVPESLADNYYLEWCGVKKYEPGAKPDKNAPAKLAGQREVEFLQSKNYPVQSVDDAQQFVGRLNPDDQEAFWKEADEWDAKRNEEAKAAAEKEEEEPTGYRMPNQPQAHVRAVKKTR